MIAFQITCSLKFWLLRKWKNIGKLWKSALPKFLKQNVTVFQTTCSLKFWILKKWKNVGKLWKSVLPKFANVFPHRLPKFVNIFLTLQKLDLLGTGAWSGTQQALNFLYLYCLHTPATSCKVSCGRRSCWDIYCSYTYAGMVM